MNYVAETLKIMQARYRADLLLYLVITAYTAIGLAMMSVSDTLSVTAYKPYMDRWPTLFMVIFPLSAVMFDLFWTVHRFDRRRRWVFSRVFGPKRMAYLVSGIMMGMIFLLFQGTFTSLKNAMFIWNGEFLYDEAQAAIDNWLHFGVDPWRLVEPLIANDMLRNIIETNYYQVYFTVCFSALFFVLSSPKADAIRTHYVACFMLSWVVVGNILAAIFLSAGPAYYGYVTGDEARFAPLLDHLAAGVESSNSTVDFQSYLWSHHTTGTPGLGSGISAFPSVHVALVTLNALFAFEIDRRLGWLMTAYCTIILASSVALGWHYAIDGYVSIVIVAVLYCATKPLLRSPQFRTSKTQQTARLGEKSPAPV